MQPKYMVAAPAFAKEGSFLQEADFPNTAHRGTEASASSGSRSNKDKEQKQEKSLLLELGACPCFSRSSPVQLEPQARELS